jgi:hypothetical protein
MAISLPVELYRPIVQAVVTRSDLHSLMRVSHAMQYEAERVIWHTFKVRTAVRLVRVCRQLRRTPRFAVYIRVFTIDISYFHGGAEREWHNPIFRSFHLLIADTLYTMTHLRDLHVHFASGPLFWSSNFLLFHSYKFKLRYFGEQSGYYLDLVPFLQDQPEIQALTLWSARTADWSPLPAIFLPELSILTANPDIAALLLPCRPVTQLRSFSMRPPLLQSLSLSAKPIIALDIHPDSPVACYRQLPDLVPELELIAGLRPYSSDEVSRFAYTIPGLC